MLNLLADGVYSSAMAPPHWIFWLVVVVGSIFTFGPFLGSLNDSDDSRRKSLIFGLCSGFGTILMLHLFGDSRILGWLYEYRTPSDTDPTIWDSFASPFGPLFWLIAFASSLIMLFNLRVKNGMWTLATLLGSLALAQFLTGVPIFPWAWHHPGQAVKWVAIFGVIGLFWLAYKWDALVRFHKQKYDELKEQWHKSVGLPMNSDLTLEDRANWTKYFESNKYNYEEQVVTEYRPRFRDHKSELTGWLVAWPVSMVETFLFDFLSSGLRYLLSHLNGMGEAVTNYRWKGTENDLLSLAEAEEINQKKKQNG